MFRRVSSHSLRMPPRAKRSFLALSDPWPKNETASHDGLASPLVIGGGEDFVCTNTGKGEKALAPSAGYPAADPSPLSNHAACLLTSAMAS